ncbi:amidohydrolase family protein [uncultured Friedmanniella sp.]|uniref:amidohydrolase family protein n=1 Tax=uncultured Friedmanniella sp. TaxID=335381 RepID=UPI0035C967F7
MTDQNTPEPEGSTVRIDVHAHYWAQSYLDLLIDLGRTDLKRFPGQPDDLADRLAVMDSVDVDYQVFSAVGLNTVLDDPADAVTAAQFINGLYSDACARFDGRFRGFATVPLPHLDEAIAETERALADPAIVGVGLPCSISGVPIDDPSFEPFWANLARHGATTVYIHPVGTDSEIHPGLGDWNLSMAYGSPLQIALAPTRILFSGLSTRYPDLQFVFALGGGILPFLWPRQERAIGRSMAMARADGRPHYLDGLVSDQEHPLDGLRRFWFDCSTQDLPLTLAAVRDTYGADRLVLGSDETHASLVEAVAYLQDSEYLTDDEREAALDRNAQSFLHLPVRTPVPV